MCKIIVFTHGSLTESLVRTSQFILDNQPDIETYYMEPGRNPEEVRSGVEQSIRRSNNSGQEVPVPTDLMHGTLFNTTIQLKKERSFTYIMSINLPLLMEVTNRRLLDGNSRSFIELVDTAKEGIVDSHVLLQTNRQVRTDIDRCRLILVSAD